MSILIELFLFFVKIGSLSFGGGYAMIPLLREEAVTKNFLTAVEFKDILAISQITPGPLAVNMATFVGFKQAGILGAIVSTAGVSLPSMTMVLILALFIKKFNTSPTIQAIFTGLRPAVVGLIFVACVRIAIEEFVLLPTSGAFEWPPVIEIKSFVLALIVLLLNYKYKINSIYLILLSAVVGLFLFA